MDNTTLLVILIAAAVLVVALMVFLIVRRRRQQRLTMAREEYGPEYQRLAEERGSEEQAERELRERREKVADRVRPLSEESRERYDEEWRVGVEQTFVNDPAAALDEADRLIERILVERNFPAGSRREASEGLGVTYPGAVEDFREAQNIHQESTSPEGSGADLEQMRRAIQKYRSVYERLTE